MVYFFSLMARPGEDFLRIVSEFFLRSAMAIFSSSRSVASSIASLEIARGRHLSVHEKVINERRRLSSILLSSAREKE